VKGVSRLTKADRRAIGEVNIFSFWREKVVLGIRQEHSSSKRGKGTSHTDGLYFSGTEGEARGRLDRFNVRAEIHGN